MWLIRFAAGASVFIALMFTGSGNHQLYNIVTVIIAAIIAWLATVVIFDDTDPATTATEKPSPHTVS